MSRRSTRVSKRSLEEAEETKKTVVEPQVTEAEPAKKQKGKGRKKADAAEPSSNPASEPPTSGAEKKSEASSSSDSAAAPATASSLSTAPLAYSSSGNFRIISWNVNGIRSALKDEGFVPFLQKINADVICIQETKADLESSPKGVLPGYKEIWNPCKTQKGYSGTLIYTKNDPISTSTTFKYSSKTDNEGRVIVVEYPNFYLINTYIPNSGQKLDRLKERTQEWDPAFLQFMVDHDQKKPIIWTGDLNVSHKEIDLENPTTNKRTAGFTPEERANFSKVLDTGFVDVFRHRNPTLAKQYTYWSYRGDARARNVGWRLDYFVVSPRLLPKIKDCIIHKDVTGSDHCPIELLLE